MTILFWLLNLCSNLTFTLQALSSISCSHAGLSPCCCPQRQKHFVRYIVDVSFSFLYLQSIALKRIAAGLLKVGFPYQPSILLDFLSSFLSFPSCFSITAPLFLRGNYIILPMRACGLCCTLCKEDMKMASATLGSCPLLCFFLPFSAFCSL